MKVMCMSYGSSWKGTIDELESTFKNMFVSSLKEFMYVHVRWGTIDTKSGWEKFFKLIQKDPNSFGFREPGECGVDGDIMYEILPTEEEFWAELKEVQLVRGQSLVFFKEEEEQVRR